MRAFTLLAMLATASAYASGSKNCDNPNSGHGSTKTLPADLKITVTDTATGAAVTSWTAGHTYTVLLKGTSSTFEGYLFAPIKGTATSFTSSQVSSTLGSFAPVESTSKKLSGCTGSITHTSAGSKTFVTATWTAPTAAGVGTINLFAMVTATKSSNWNIFLAVPEAGAGASPTASATKPAGASPTASASKPASATASISKGASASASPTSAATPASTPAAAVLASPAGKPAASPSRTGGALSAPAPSSAATPPFAAAVGGAIGGGVFLGIAATVIAVFVYRRQGVARKLASGSGGGFTGSAPDARTSVLGNPLAAGAAAPPTLPRSSSRSVFTPVNAHGAEAEDDVVMNPYARPANA